MRYVIEGIWSGYVSSQSRVVHREVTTSRTRAEALKKIHGIMYTDGTMLYLHVREARPRERVKTHDGYGRLLNKVIWHFPDANGVVKVADLPA